MDKSPLDSWGTLHSGASFAALEQTKKKADKMEKKVTRRNVLEYIAGAIVIGTSAYSGYHAALEGEWFVVSAFAALALGTMVVMFNLHRIASSLPRQPEEDCRTHLRAQLVRQERALATVPKWYLAPILPGALLILLAAAEVLSREAGWLAALAGMMPSLVIFAAIFGFVFWLNARGARKLRQQISDLDKVG